MELRNCVYGNVKCEWHDCWSSVDHEIVSGPVIRTAVAQLTKVVSGPVRTAVARLTIVVSGPVHLWIKRNDWN